MSLSEIPEEVGKMVDKVLGPGHRTLAAVIAIAAVAWLILKRSEHGKSA